VKLFSEGGIEYDVSCVNALENHAEFLVDAIGIADLSLLASFAVPRDDERRRVHGHFISQGVKGVVSQWKGGGEAASF
jgi:hypothetical protein